MRQIALLTGLFSAMLNAAPPLIWFAPLDPVYRSQVGYSGSPQYSSLFTPQAAWSQAAAHVNVFKIYGQWLFLGPEADLRAQFADLDRRGIALALEFGVLSSGTGCGDNVEGFNGQLLLTAAQRIQQLGGTLRYVAMDEPTYYGTIYDGVNACRWTVDQMATSAATNIRALLLQFPNVQIGDIEPFGGDNGPPNAIAKYQAGIDAFRKALGFAPAFFHADVFWPGHRDLTDLQAARQMAVAEKLPFGVIYNGGDEDSSDAQWIGSAAQHMYLSEFALGTPDMVIFQSWNRYPQKLLPETDADAFPSIIDRYFLPRTTLSASNIGNSIRGKLTDANGSSISNAPIQIAATPLSGAGVPTVYSIDTPVPVGTQSIVFGARVNIECGCSGTTDVSVSAFSAESTGLFLARNFVNQLAGWGTSTAGGATAAIEGAALHLKAQAAQTILLNSAPIPFNAGGLSITLRVNAQVAPGSSGSGYFFLAFVGSSGEISRVRIPFASATLSLGTAVTDPDGTFSLPLSATETDTFQITADYAGTEARWPAHAQSSFSNGEAVRINAVVNSASYAGGAVSPGEVVVVFGSGLGPGSLVRGEIQSGGFTTSLAQIEARFDGIAAPILYTSSGQTAVVVPYGIPTTQTSLTFSTPAGKSLPFLLAVQPSAPGLFTSASSGTGPLAALNSDGSYNSANNPAHRGDSIVLFGTGEGQTTPTGIDGLIATVLAKPLLAPVATIGGEAAVVEYFGSAPGQVAGVFQLNLRVPSNAPAGDSQPVILRVGNASTTSVTTVAIR